MAPWDKPTGRDCSRIFCSGNCPSTLKGKFACPMCLMPFGTKVPQKNACKHTREACINLQRSQHNLQDDELRGAWVDARGSHFVGPNSLCIVSADVARLAADTSCLKRAHDSLEERVVQLEGVQVPSYLSPSHDSLLALTGSSGVGACTASRTTSRTTSPSNCILFCWRG